MGVVSAKVGVAIKISRALCACFFLQKPPMQKPGSATEHVWVSNPCYVVYNIYGYTNISKVLIQTRAI